ncbi:MAG: YdcF family protein [Clostridia bacterium]|nr:YdcF family protein [Clostridia bacterium]
MKAIIKTIITIIGSAITLNGIALFFVSNVNLGNFLSIGLGAVIILIALFFNKLARWLKILLISGIGAAVALSSFLIIYGKSDNVSYKEDAIIVLGAAVHGKTPSRTLKYRLKKAVEYHKQNSNAIIIVSGGQGAQEDISEAEAMKIYLIENGVKSDKIIKEDKSTSTTENFKFSKEILDQHFSRDYSIAFITNEYHILRASLCARRAGFESTTHLHSNTSTSYLLSGVLRECLAVVKYLVFKN